MIFVQQIHKKPIKVGVNEKAALAFPVNCPFVYTIFDFSKVNKVASVWSFNTLFLIMIILYLFRKYEGRC